MYLLSSDALKSGAVVFGAGVRLRFLSAESGLIGLLNSNRAGELVKRPLASGSVPILSNVRGPYTLNAPLNESVLARLPCTGMIPGANSSEYVLPFASAERGVTSYTHGL